MVPATQIRFREYLASGEPNLLRFSPQMTTVKIWSGYGLSKFKNVGCPRVRSAKRAVSTIPQTIACSPTCCFASDADKFCTATTHGAKKTNKNKTQIVLGILQCRFEGNIASPRFLSKPERLGGLESNSFEAQILSSRVLHRPI
jgi:hypothetical protein